MLLRSILSFILPSLSQSISQFHPNARHLSIDTCKNQISSEFHVQYATIIVTSLNILSSVFILLAFLLYRKEKKAETIKMRILVYQNLFGAFFSIALLIEAVTMCFRWNTGGWYCSIQASVTNFCILSTQAWSLAFGIHLYFSLNKDVSYSKLRRIFRRIEVFFFIVTVFIIPAPFIVMIFKLPVGPNGAWISLYGVSSRDWCDFSAEWEVDGTIVDARDVAFYLEMSLFYLPMLCMFFTNAVLYCMIQVRLWRLSKRLKKRRFEKAQAKNAFMTAASLNAANGGNTVISSATPPTHVIPKHATLVHARHNTPTKNYGEKEPLLHSSDGGRMEELTLHQVFERDAEQYTKYMQNQMRTATYYMLAFLLSTTVWLASRLTWEFMDCTPDTKFIFLFLLIVLQCTGPRIECLTLSVIFGIAEDTVAPKSLEDILSNMLTLRYFHHFCCQQTVDLYRTYRKQGMSFYAGHTQVVEHENLLYFYFDVRILSDLAESENYMITSKILKYARDISKDYMSEGMMSLHLDLCSQQMRNQIRTIAANLTREKDVDTAAFFMSDSVEGYNNGAIYPPNGGSAQRLPSFDEPFGEDSQSSINSVMESPPLLDRLSGDDSEDSSQSSESEMTDPSSQLKSLIALLRIPQRECLNRMRNALSLFRKSPLFSEMLYELRINHQTSHRRRSLYYDVSRRAFAFCCRFLRPNAESDNLSRMSKDELYKFIAKEKKRKKRRIMLVKRDFEQEGLM